MFLYDKMILLNKYFKTDLTPQNKMDLINHTADFCVEIENDIFSAAYEDVVNAVVEITDYCNCEGFELNDFNRKFEELSKLFALFVDQYEAELAKEPIISFILPTYNRGHVAKQCIENILSYPGDDIELVVTNDGSTDDTHELIGNIKDKRYKYFKNEKNLGLCANEIETFGKATGRFLFLLSDEDKILMDKIPNVISIIKNNPNLSLLLEDFPRSSFKNEYNFAIVPRGDAAIKRVGVKLYMTGLIFNRYYMDFEDIYKNVKQENHGYLGTYPHVYISLNNVIHHDVALLGDMLYSHAFEEPQLNQEVFGGFYTKLVPRTRTFQTFLEIIYALCKEMQTFLDLLGRLSNEYLSAVSTGYPANHIAEGEDRKQVWSDNIKFFFDDSTEFLKRLIQDEDKARKALNILKERYICKKEELEALKI